MTSDFAPDQVALLAAALVFHLASLVTFQTGRTRLALALLVGGALVLRVFMALLDPFLNPWDEQFHALVAKNMLVRPFAPLLYADPVLPSDATLWTQTHVWLHKPPLALWQVALAYRAFGVSETATRIPSVVLGSGFILLLYRIGSVLVTREAGYYAALLASLANYQLRLVAGALPTDHVDVAFLFYVTASFWAWLELQRSGRVLWVVPLGLFAGLAVLTKSLGGLLVLAAWAVALVVDWVTGSRPSDYRRFGVTVAIALAAVLPWELYVTAAYPFETAFERAYTWRHFFEAIEGHREDAWYHLRMLRVLYGPLTPYVLIPAFVVLHRGLRDRSARVVCATMIVAVYGGFSLAMTKMPSYPIIVSAIVYVALGALVASVVVGMRTRIGGRAGQASALVLVVLVAFFDLNLKQIAHAHGRRHVSDRRRELVRSAAAYKQLAQTLRSGDSVLFNCRPGLHAAAMFYTGRPAYDFLPSEEIIPSLIERGFTIALFDDGDLPRYLSEDARIIKVPRQP